MKLVGIALVLAGWLVAMSGLFITSSNGGRILIACIGIALSLYGSLGGLNGYHLERALWKK